MQAGLLIALEGIDGAGTTTQMARLAQHIAARGRQVLTTAEPSQGIVGRMIRQALAADAACSEAALALLFAADRLEHVRVEMQPVLDAGGVVLTDRYVMSSYAYQSSRLPSAWVRQLNMHARPPDATLFFQVDPALAAQRRAQRGGATERFDDLLRQQDVDRAYRTALTLPGLGHVHTVDANQDIDHVFLQLQRLVDTLLGAA